MDIKVLKASITANTLPKFFIFVEKEPALCKQYITAMSNTLGKAYSYYNTADEVLYDITTNLRNDYLYVIYDDKKILENLDYIEHLIKTGRHIIVSFSELDKGSALYKKYKEYVTIFNKLDEWTLLAYLQKQCKENKVSIEQDKLRVLINRCDCNLGMILNEMDKIFTLAQSNSNLLMEYMLNNGFSDFRKINIFVFIDKLLAKDKTAFEDLIKITDSPVTIIYNLYKTAKKRLFNTRKPFYGYIMSLCYEIYNGIIDGTMSDKYALKYLMLQLFALK